MAKTQRFPARRRVDPLRLSDLAYDRIKRDIVNCELRPGGAVTEMQLTLRYHLGKAPVRAALVRLHQEGLVRPVPRRGYVVAPITIKDVQDLFEFRLLLEPGTARLVAGRIGADELRRLKELTRADRLTGTAFNRANTEFHVAIARGAGNHRVADALAQLLEGMERLFHLRLTPEDQTDDDHKELLEALAAGDGAAAERIAATHIEKARERVMEAIFSSPDLMSVQITADRAAGEAPAPAAQIYRRIRR